MAPELFQKQGVNSYASDLWSFGCTLFEMAAGKPPFSSDSLNDLITQIRETPTPQLEAYSKDFNNLLIALLEKDPANRMQWKTLRSLKIWEEPLPEIILAPQPQFDNYLIGRGIVLESYYEGTLQKKSKSQENAQNSPRLTGSNKKKDIDILRLSQTVKQNILKDTHEYDSKNTDKGNLNFLLTRKIVSNDIHLESKDQELDFSQKPEEEKGQTENVPEEIEYSCTFNINIERNQLVRISKLSLDFALAKLR